MPWISFWTLKLKPHQNSPKSPQKRNCNGFQWDNLYHNVMTLDTFGLNSCWTLAGNPCWLAASCAALGPPRWMSIGCLDVVVLSSGFRVGWFDGKTSYKPKGYPRKGHSKMTNFWVCPRSKYSPSWQHLLGNSSHLNVKSLLLIAFFVGGFSIPSTICAENNHDKNHWLDQLQEVH